MKTLIAKKYPSGVIEAREIDQKRKMENMVFILALARGDTDDLRRLFEDKSSEVLAVLRSRYKLEPRHEQEHLRMFPTHYQMDEIIGENAIGLTFKFATDYQWDKKKIWEVIEILIKNGANPLALLTNPNTNFDELKKVIAWGANVSTHYKGYNALHALVCCKDDFDKKMSLLIERGINVNGISMETAGSTPLHLFLANELISEALKLITLARDKLDINLKDGESKTPLLLAAKIRSKEVVTALLDTFKGKINVNADDDKKRTALHFACAYGDVEMAAMLIAAGADINAKDHRDNTPLHYANAKEASVRAILEGIEIHPDRDIHAKRNAVTNTQMFSLRIGKDQEEVLATKSNLRQHIGTFLAIVSQVSNHHREKDIQFLSEQLEQFAGKSLITVCMEGHAAVVKLLLQNDADVWISNMKGNKPSDIAQDAELKQLLLSHEQAVLSSMQSSLEFLQLPACVIF